jgi:flagellar biosynthesis protein FlhA
MTQSIGTSSAAHRSADVPSGGSVHVLDYLVPATILLAVLVVLAPVPAPVVDLLLAANLTVSVLALLGALAARTPLEMSVFPTFLLGATLVRLVLNISTTRLILSRAAIDGASAAGEVVEAFGQFVSANNIVVGGVIFAIIAIVQFVVITAGATRTSEVAARFTLDGLPGRQMAIDAEVSAGTITRDQARGLRLELQRQADFFASMDGASRFVRGEAVASVIITLVNLIGGLAIGMLQHGMPLSKAVEVYSRLTIGDGLVGAVPSLFVAVATGLLISRSTQAVNLSQELGRQFVARPHVLLITAVFLAVLSLTGMPFLPLAGMAALTLFGAWMLGRSGRGAKAASAAPQERDRPSEKLADVLTDDRIVVELGRGLLGLVSGAGAAPLLLEKSQALRSAVAADLGVVVPAIAFKDDLALPDRGYRIMLAGEPIHEAILESRRRTSAAADAESLAADLEAVVRRRADALLTRDAAARLVESLRASQPALVEQVVPDVLTVARIQRTLQCLLREGVPIRPLAPLLEVMADHAAEAKEPAALAELVRHGLSRTICRRVRDGEGRLVVVKLTNQATDALLAGGSAAAKAVVADVRRAVRPRLERAAPAVVVVEAERRRAVREALARPLPELAVLSHDEVADEERVEVFATIGAADAQAA